MGKFNLYNGEEIIRSSFVIESGTITLRELMIACYGMPLDPGIWCYRQGEVRMHRVLPVPRVYSDLSMTYTNLVGFSNPIDPVDDGRWMTLGKLRSACDLVEECERKIIITLGDHYYNRYSVEIWSTKDTKWTDRPHGSIKFILESHI